MRSFLRAATVVLACASVLAFAAPATADIVKMKAAIRD
jgi:hypothetical protein